MQYVKTLYEFGGARTTFSRGSSRRAGYSREVMLYDKGTATTCVSEQDLEAVAANALLLSTMGTSYFALSTDVYAVPPRRAVAILTRQGQRTTTYPNQNDAFKFARIIGGFGSYSVTPADDCGNCREIVKPVPILDVRIPFNLATSPVDTVDDKLGRTNGDNVTLSDKSFGANTILFDGFDLEAIDPDGQGTSDSIRFVGEYRFLIREDGWTQGKCCGTGTAEYMMYSTATFAGTSGFPV